MISNQCADACLDRYALFYAFLLVSYWSIRLVRLRLWKRVSYLSACKPASTLAMVSRPRSSMSPKAWSCLELLLACRYLCCATAVNCGLWVWRGSTCRTAVGTEENITTGKPLQKRLHLIWCAIILHRTLYGTLRSRVNAPFRWSTDTSEWAISIIQPDTIDTSIPKSVANTWR